MSSTGLGETEKKFLRRSAAGAYLKEKFGFCSAGVLAKYAVVGGGPEFQYLGGWPVYTTEALDSWALSKLSAPVRSTSERKAALHAAA
ncbi:MAG TPA: hypothetical protein VK446_05200 [Methylocystis sp.]|nr:hypothetical protein [Methylocystis sp.]